MLSFSSKVSLPRLIAGVVLLLASNNLLADTEVCGTVTSAFGLGNVSCAPSNQGNAAICNGFHTYLEPFSGNYCVGNLDSSGTTACTFQRLGCANLVQYSYIFTNYTRETLTCDDVAGTKIGKAFGGSVTNVCLSNCSYTIIPDSHIEWDSLNATVGVFETDGSVCADDDTAFVPTIVVTGSSDDPTCFTADNIEICKSADNTYTSSGTGPNDEPPADQTCKSDANGNTWCSST
ncbi:MAG: hypothetical protein ACI9VI_003533, partial [Candidatus Azotimanducaceae bacterium]